jgi:hypothetical protein
MTGHTPTPQAVLRHPEQIGGWSVMLHVTVWARAYADPAIW